MQYLFKPPKVTQGDSLIKKATACFQNMATHLVIANPMSPPELRNASETTVDESTRLPSILNEERSSLATVKWNTKNVTL